MDFRKNIMTSFKGACMGAADVIPGVSGGTILFPCTNDYMASTTRLCYLLRGCYY